MLPPQTPHPFVRFATEPSNLPSQITPVIAPCTSFAADASRCCNAPTASTRRFRSKMLKAGLSSRAKSRSR